MRRQRVWVAILVGAVALTAGALTAGAEEPDRMRVGEGRDYLPPQAPRPGTLDLQAPDPLGLLPGIDYLRAHSLGSDVIDVWTCDLGVDVDTVVAQLDSEVLPYFQEHSQGRYEPDFVPRGNAAGQEQECYNTAADNASADANGVLIAGPWSGGLATPGTNGPSFPDNDRWALVGYPHAFSMVAAHEIGHMLTWPHSSTGASESDYDNALDLMSGNYAANGATHPLPYASAVINRYAAGWIDPQDVAVVGGS
ncbi:MAG: hypothetical protein ACLFWM_10705, partial [Actinomycetota bacterium]